MKFLIFFLLSISCMAQQKSDFGMNDDGLLTPKPLKIGDLAPNFSGIDQYGNAISLDDMLSEGSVLVIFYRGYWCGYCQKNLAEFQEEFSSLSSAGVQVVAIAPETQQNVDKTIQKNNIEFSVISDNDNSIMKKYNVAFNVTKAYQDKVLKFTDSSLNVINNQKEAILPIPAAYLINAKGKISFVHFDPDYSKRVTVSQILNQL